MSTATAAHLLASLQSQLGPKQMAVSLARERPVSPQRGGVTSLPAAACESLVMPGAVVELSGLPGSGLCSLALLVMAECLARAIARGAPTSWLGAIDPGLALHAPAVGALGIPLSRFVVISPPLEDLPRLSVRAMRSGAFCALLIDATHIENLDLLGVAARRLTLAAEASESTVLLVTSSLSRRSLPLPVAARAHVHASPEGSEVHFLRHRQGTPPPFFVDRAAPLVDGVLHPHRHMHRRGPARLGLIHTRIAA